MRNKKLVYLCPICGKRFEAHIRGEVFEKKPLFCADDGAVMNIGISEGKVNAHIKAKRT